MNMGRQLAYTEGHRTVLCAIAVHGRPLEFVLPPIMAQFAEVLKSKPAIHVIAQMRCLQNADVESQMARLKQWYLERIDAGQVERVPAEDA